MVYRGAGNMENMELENLSVDNLTTDSVVAEDDLTAKDDLIAGDDLTVGDDATVGDDLTVGGDINLSTGAKIVCSGTGTDGMVLKNLKNTTGELSGDAKVIEIDSGGTPYYFSVYPTKA